MKVAKTLSKLKPKARVLEQQLVKIKKRTNKVEMRQQIKVMGKKIQRTLQMMELRYSRRFLAKQMVPLQETTRLAFQAQMRTQLQKKKRKWRQMHQQQPLPQVLRWDQHRLKKMTTILKN
jgi:hypothetical protein